MMLLQAALGVLNGTIGATYADRIEAFQFLCDNYQLDRLTPLQESEYNMLVESGTIKTAPFRSDSQLLEG